MLEQIREQLEQMKEYLAAMKEDRIEFSAFHEEDSDVMLDLDLDILIASQTIRDLERQAKEL